MNIENIFFLSYYIEAVGSRQSGGLTLSINSKMLDTGLTDKVSSNVKNEIQEIEISSVATPESFVSCFFFQIHSHQ